MLFHVLCFIQKTILTTTTTTTTTTSPADLCGVENASFTRGSEERPPVPEARGIQRDPGSCTGNTNRQGDHNHHAQVHTHAHAQANHKPRRFLKQPKPSNPYSRENPAFEADYLEVLPPLDDTLQGAAAADEGYEVPVKSGLFDHLYNRCGGGTVVPMATEAVVNEGYEVPVQRGDGGLHGDSEHDDYDSEEIYEEINEDEMLNMKSR